MSHQGKLTFGVLLSWQVGRESPADIIVPVPTVSTRHAMLRLGAVLTHGLYCASSRSCLRTYLWLLLTCCCFYLLCHQNCVTSARHPGAPAENNRVSVTDLSSTNGTYLDDEELVPLRAIQMSVGAEITFGNSLYLFTGKYVHAWHSCTKC